MQLSKLKLVNYKSFSDFMFRFPKEPGLYLLTGENKVDPELGANAVGKSSIGSALAYLFYGVDPNRGVNTKDIRKWGTTKKDTARVIAIAGGEKIGRDIPASLNQKSDYAAKYLNGMPFKAFMSSVYFSQFGRFLFDLTPTEKSALLGEIIGLDIWDECVKVSADKLKAAVDQENDISRKLATHRATQDERLARIKELRKEVKQAEREHAKKKTRIEGRLKQARAEEKKLSSQLQAYTKSVDSSYKNIRKYKEFREVVHSEYDKAFRVIAESEAELRRANKDIDLYENGVCPTCEKPFDAEHDIEHLEGIYTDKRDAEESLMLARIVKQDHLEQYEMANDDIDELEKVQQKRIESKHRISGELQAAKNEISTLLIALTELEETTKARDDLKKAEAGYTALKSKGATLRKRLESARKDVEAYTYWKGEGFKRIKLELIEQATKRIEFEVNEVLVSIGMGNWKVSIAYDYETESGESRKGFTVYVSNHTINSRVVPWEAFSGGERQRIKIGGMIGLANVIDDEFDAPLSFEHWDEPTTWLHSNGIEALVSILRERARAKGKVILLADHRVYSSNLAAISLQRTVDGVKQIAGG